MSTAHLHFYSRFRTSGLQDQIGNWENLLTFGQYKTAFEKTLSRVPAGSKVLDWGCGNGHFSYFLVQSNYKTTGYSYEPRPALFEREPRFTFAPGKTGDPTGLPFADGEFDAVFSIGVLEHVHQFGGDQAKSIRELHRIVKPGGLFLCFHLPNRYTWIEFIARLIHRAGSSIHVHDRLYDRPRIEALLHTNGFTLLESGRYAFFPRGVFRRAPHAIKNSVGIARCFDFLDALFGKVLGVFCQNWYFIAVKQERA